MKKLVFSTLAVALLAGCASSDTSNIHNDREGHVPNIVRIKYRIDSVDVGLPSFEYLNTSRSSFVRGAWYDGSNRYMVIDLSGTYYHYCRMPRVIWNNFQIADSFGKAYNKMIKGRFDCRIGTIPSYK